jgi:hypothetical protein
MMRAHAITRILPASVCPVKALVPFSLHRPSRRACSTWSGRPPWLASARMVPRNKRHRTFLGLAAQPQRLPFRVVAHEHSEFHAFILRSAR